MPIAEQTSVGVRYSLGIFSSSSMFIFSKIPFPTQSDFFKISKTSSGQNSGFHKNENFSDHQKLKNLIFRSVPTFLFFKFINPTVRIKSAFSYFPDCGKAYGSQVFLRHKNLRMQIFSKTAKLNFFRIRLSAAEHESDLPQITPADNSDKISYSPLIHLTSLCTCHSFPTSSSCGGLWMP